MNTPEKYVRDHNDVGFLFIHVVVVVAVTIRLVGVAGEVGAFLLLPSTPFTVNFLLKFEGSELGQLHNLRGGREHAKENCFLGNFEKFYVEEVTLYYY